MKKIACLFVCLFVGSVNATVIEIGLPDFDNATVIDFESTALGSISGTNSLFTNAGISSITATPQGSDTDEYNSRTNSSRALGGNNNGLFIADPGTSGAADTNDWLIEFLSPQFRFGFGTHDQNTLPLVTLLLDGVQVGSLSNSPTDFDLFQLYFESTVAFDAITISQPGTASGFGFLLDNLTVEASSVPEPTSLVLLGLGLAGIGFSRNKKIT